VTDDGLAPAAVDGGEPQPVAARPAAPPVAGAGAAQTDRPELPVAAAFAGGFVLAMILRRVAR
jgi:hypothetical protein